MNEEALAVGGFAEPFDLNTKGPAASKLWFEFLPTLNLQQFPADRVLYFESKDSLDCKALQRRYAWEFKWFVNAVINWAVCSCGVATDEQNGDNAENPRPFNDAILHSIESA